jgi:hypothetical protein
MGSTSAVVETRVCPHCRQPTRIAWPLCDGCSRTLPAYRPLPDLRLAAELERWDRANPRPLDGAALVRRTIAWLWGAVVVCSALDLHFGRRIGPISSGWDELAVGSLMVALLATLLGVVALVFVQDRDPAPDWRRERAAVKRRLGIGSPAE